MGASFWNAHLVGADDETTKLPYALSVAPLQPWSPDGTRFAYLGTEKLRQPGRVLLGDIAAGFRWTTAPTGARGIFWSSSQPVLLTIGPGWLRLLDQQGRMTRSHDWRNGEDDPVYGGCAALLDRWSDARYDPATGDLRLAVYRPTGPVGPELAPAFQQLSELTAPAAMQWIAVRVSE